ncbi:uncharacterized protein LOC125950837 [Anopheles darlingi]|uniref:uncharacterized protein LOC125950837 n=1 Tax=Anopheles darlingi TaxID=43151 RepID=UPI0021003578|nr:uncharacterized protein LOC125950837 [Anopheles darlingi]XP_049535131.1 uncharacterized protein LOC125950837 [Anopheles darlingi]XP_049535132.1 uncharacterized protein LOC125950837 [Anopheles darlingi]XP_049535133.1 uncharacterized protein LOC125950837 [Anopheles darlingi]XP_049535134.1 uncharacterized protein LOC125950837 [Anopheles darlingi]
MTNPADGGGKVLVNVSSARSKGSESGKKRSSVQSKNVPDSRSSTASGSTSIGGSGAGGGIVTSASSAGGFQSFFRWFRRDESRVLARSTSGSQVTPELLDRHVQQRQPPRSPSVSPVATPAAGLRESFTRATPPAQLAPAPPSRERQRTAATAGGDNVSQTASNGTHSSSPSPGPVIDCQNLSKSSSCDSILSTATNGFAFVPPNCYEAVLVASAGGDSERFREPRTIQPGPYTDSYKRRCWQRDQARELDRKYELTLRKKYRLFPNLPRDSPPVGDGHDATLTRDNQRTVYTDLSLPTRSIEASTNQRNGAYVGQPEEASTDPVNRRHRRTVSDSSKDRRAGAYVHVKGKRKAPPPPPPNGLSQEDGSSTGGTLTRSSTSNYGTLSPGSTLSRRKRPAPAPPATPIAVLNEPSAGSSTSLLEDKEIKAIIEGRPLPVHTEEPPRLIMPLPLIRPLSPLPNISEERAPPGGLTEEQKQQLIDNIRKVQSQTAQQQEDDPCDVMKMEERFNRANGTRSPIHDYLYAEAMASANAQATSSANTAATAATAMSMGTSTAGAAPTSPIAPRPWYKRPISGMRHQDSSLPFKRDVILRTLDKRKGSQIAGGTSGPSKDPCDDLPEVGFHRNSLLHPTDGPAMASNSTNSTSPASSLGSRGGGGGGGSKFNLFSKITEKADSEKRRSAIGIPSISELDREAAEIIQSERAAAREIEKPKSTKELISKFEATSTPVVGKVTVSSTFVAKKEYFGVEPQKKLTTPTDPPQQASQSTVAALTPEKTPDTSKASGVTSDKNLLGLWMCPYCTLENPNWRIICEACERIKPYDSALSILEEPPLHPNHPLKRPIPIPAEPKRTTTVPSDDTWDRKQERVLKYFVPKPSTGPATNGTLLVGATDINGNTGLPNRKPSFGQTKLLASPKMGVKSLMNRGAVQDVATPSTSAGLHRHFNGMAPSEVQPTANSNKFDDQKLKESGNAFVAAPLASPEPTEEGYSAGVVGSDRINLEEIRSARIARFGVVPDTDSSSSSSKPEDQRPSESPQPDALEREKERLREMIRAMNAKALAERYPVVQKPPTASTTTSTPGSNNPSNSLKRDSPLVQRKNGLTSGIPISTKSSSPLPRRKVGSPLMARRAASPAPPNPESNPTGAIRKTTAFVLQPPSESKIMNHDTTRSHTYGSIPETVLELNQMLASPPEPTAGPSLVLTNDVQAMHYEPMDEQQFVRSTAAPVRQTCDSAIPLSPRLQDRHRKTLMEKQQQHDEKVRQISDQLRSQQGVDRFRSTLALYPSANMGRTGTLALNKLLRNLEQAISEGAHDRAAELAMDLAKMKVSLSVTRQSSPGLGDISLKVFIDDKLSHKGPLRVVMATLGTLGQLKQKMCNEYQLPVAVQRWRCADRSLEDDDRTLLDYGIQTNDQTLHVYLVQPPEARPVLAQPCFNRTETKLLTVVSSESSDGEHSDTQNDDATVLGATALPKPTPRSSRPKEATIAEEPQPPNEEGWACSVCTLINEPDRPGCAACSGSRPASYIPPSARRRLQTATTTTVTVTPEDLKRFLDEQPPLTRPVPPVAVQLRSPPLETRNDLNRISSNRKSSDIFNILLDESKAIGTSGQPATAAATTPPVPKPRTATDLVRPVHIQVPEQSRIVMTALTSHRSPNITRSQYRGVDNFNPNSSGLPKPERPIITTASPIVRAVLLKQPLHLPGDPQQQYPVRFGRNGLALPEDGTEVMQNHYTELVNLDNADLIANIEPFECPICFGPFQPYEGIVLRDCLHSFCKQCLISTIQYSDEAEIRCPYSDAVYSCESVIQQREIKALVSKELYEAHLAKSIQQAESKIDNTFHCRTPNCRGWCIYEDNVNQFKCPVCTIVNCLTCRVIHDGLDCKQYQDRMNSDCDTNIEARRTKAMLQEMIEKGDALNCPTCQVIVMKKWGCDWLKCSMCKTEICWVTRGARWGPAGKGDTSGGCRCGVNGIKCHPKCNYCH